MPFQNFYRPQQGTAKLCGEIADNEKPSLRRRQIGIEASGAILLIAYYLPYILMVNLTGAVKLMILNIEHQESLTFGSGLKFKIYMEERHRNL